MQRLASLMPIRVRRYCLCCGEIYFYARRTGRHPLPSEHFATALRQSGDVHLGDDDGGIIQP